MAKGLPFLLLRNSAILKPKNQNEDIWNSNGDVPTVGNTNSCFATHFWGCRSKKWRLSLRNCGRAQCLYPFQLRSVLQSSPHFSLHFAHSTKKTRFALQNLFLDFGPGYFH